MSVNPIKRIMSEIHKDARAGKLDLGGHGGFVGEVKRRVRAAGLSEDEIPDLIERRRGRKAGEDTPAGPV